MELSYVIMRRRAVAILFWSAIAIAIVAILIPVATDVPMPVAATILALSALFTLWLQWKNGRSGFGSVRGLRPTYETRAMLSPGQWLVLLLILVAQAASLAFVLVS